MTKQQLLTRWTELNALMDGPDMGNDAEELVCAEMDIVEAQLRALGHRFEWDEEEDEWDGEDPNWRSEGWTE